MSESQSIFVHLGQAGIQTGSAYWDLIWQEQGVDQDGSRVQNSRVQNSKYAMNAVFHENSDGKFFPRAVWIDSDPGTGKASSKWTLGSQPLCCGKEDSSGNYARARKMAQGELGEIAVDSIRRKCEECDNLVGIFVTSGISGGTGSALQGYLSSTWQTEFSGMVAFNIYPSFRYTLPLEPYNLFLGINDYVGANGDVNLVFDNDGLKNLIQINHLGNLTYENMNSIMAQQMSMITAGIREQTQTSFGHDMRFNPRILPSQTWNFALNSYSILQSPNHYAALNVNSLMHKLSSRSTAMFSADPAAAKYVHMCLIWRGVHNLCSMNDELWRFRQSNALEFVDWIPQHWSTGYVKHNMQTVPGSSFYETQQQVSMISWSTAFEEILKRYMNDFSSMFRQKAFLHYLLQEGVEYSELEQAQDTVKQMLSDYHEIGLPIDES